MERAGSTSTSFAHNTFGSGLSGAVSGMVHWKREEPLVPKDRLISKFLSGLHYPIVLEEGWVHSERSVVFFYIVL